MSTDAILTRLTGLHPKLIDLSLDRIERLLADLGDPHLRLPPVIHVAGTNGKGSTIAVLRAVLEAAGQRVHIYTSPHLVNFRERIRLAGRLVDDERLIAALETCETVNAGRPITFFEITTAAAFLLFAGAEADYLLLEVGMGGRLDTTNVVRAPLATVITPVALDHQQYLGESVDRIAGEKAGILKPGCPAVIGRQSDAALAVVAARAAALGITPFVAGRDYDAFAQGGRLVYQDANGLLDLPPPRLVGRHQLDNAGLAIATARHLGLPVSEAQLAEGLRSVSWPGRLTPLTGRLRRHVAPDQELWLDGGHNPHGAAALAVALADMDRTRPAPLVLVLGMMNTRDPAAFLGMFEGHIAELFTVAIPGEANSHSAEAIAEAGAALGISSEASADLDEAIARAATIAEARIVICGSLYLAGHALELNGTVPE